MSGPTGRALALLSLLQTHRFWSGAELADRLEVSERTLRRDVDRLRSFGYPVDATTGKAGGYRLAAGAHLPPLLLDDDEAVAISVGLRSTAMATIDGMGDISARALAKLEQVLPDRLRRRVRAVHSSITPVRWGEQGTTGLTVDPEALAVLGEACRDHVEARFDYRSREGEETSRLVEPHQLVTGGTALVPRPTFVATTGGACADRLTEPRLAGRRFCRAQSPKVMQAHTSRARSVRNRSCSASRRRSTCRRRTPVPRCVGSTSTYRRSTPAVAARCFGRSQRTRWRSASRMAALAANIDLEDDHAVRSQNQSRDCRGALVAPLACGAVSLLTVDQRRVLPLIFSVTLIGIMGNALLSPGDPRRACGVRRARQLGRHLGGIDVDTGRVRRPGDRAARGSVGPPQRPGPVSRCSASGDLRGDRTDLRRLSSRDS